MLKKFIDHKLQAKSLKQIDQANEIISEYLADGLTLILRQLFYQFVARDLLANAMNNYKSLGTLMKKGREAGLVSWDAIEDRGRQALKVQGESSPLGVVDGLEDHIVIDPWEDQGIYPEVWIEKDSLIGTIERVCSEFRVTYTACRGYQSVSEMFRAGFRRFRAAQSRGKRPVIIHMGDHDPSGIDMTRDIEERATLYAGFPVEVRRIALNMDQIEQYAPPPNFAKETDTRTCDYVAKFGEESWELDALEPRVLSGLVRGSLNSCITDQAAWDAVTDREEAAKTHLRQLHDRWDDVTSLLDQEA